LEEWFERMFVDSDARVGDSRLRLSGRANLESLRDYSLTFCRLTPAQFNLSRNQVSMQPVLPGAVLLE
jgi:hypothetical protein